MVGLRSASGFAWVAGVAVVVVHPGAATAADPSLVRLDEAFAERAAAIARQADDAGTPEVAALVRGWAVPEPRDRQVVFAIPPRLEKPACVDTPGAEAAWSDFVAARRVRAAGTFRLALEAARAHATMARAAPAAADAPPVARRSCAAVALVHRALRDDPEHAGARAAAGYVRRGDTWTWPEVARRLDRGQEFSAEFGWLPRGRLARYRRGERHDRGRWLSAEADAARMPTVADGRHYDSDHWEILSAAPLEAAAALAAVLEETHLVWRQVFGGFGIAPADLEARFEGRASPKAGEPFAAVLCATRAQYVAELEPLEPAAGLTQAVYWRPTQTAWFFAAAGGVGAPADTVRHEAAHQLFAETVPTSPLAGERSGFWALEAAACHMESVHAAPWGWTVGGLDAGRVPAARALVVEENFFVPLEELAALGRKEFQADPRLARIYDQLGGLADFFMHGRDGRYREAFVQYLGRVYAGTDDSDTLARLCGTTFAVLDAEYRRHLSR